MSSIATSKFEDGVGLAKRITAAALAGAAVAGMTVGPALAQGVGKLPAAGIANVGTGVIQFIAITIGVIGVALGLAYGIFQCFFRQEGPGIMIRSTLAGSMFGSVIGIAVWAVGTSMSGTTRIPTPL